MSRRIRIKVCGITNADDAMMASDLGVDALGLVFYARSPRAVQENDAQRILDSVPPFVATVGLFLDARSEFVRRIIETVRLNLLQFHGDECPADCERFGIPYVKAIPMSANVDVMAYMKAYPSASGFLLDSHAAGAAGGTGEVFDWSRWPAGASRRLVLAGGLTPENVGEAIRQTRPYAVDVSSGVERDKGLKDPNKMASFVREVRRVDCNGV